MATRVATRVAAHGALLLFALACKHACRHLLQAPARRTPCRVVRMSLVETGMQATHTTASSHVRWVTTAHALLGLCAVTNADCMRTTDTASSKHSSFLAAPALVVRGRNLVNAPNENGHDLCLRHPLGIASATHSALHVACRWATCTAQLQHRRRRPRSASAPATWKSTKKVGGCTHAPEVPAAEIMCADSPRICQCIQTRGPTASLANINAAVAPLCRRF